MYYMRATWGLFCRQEILDSTPNHFIWFKILKVAWRVLLIQAQKIGDNAEKSGKKSRILGKMLKTQ